MDSSRSWNTIFQQINTRTNINPVHVLNTVEKARKPTEVYVSEENLHRHNEEVERNIQNYDGLYAAKPSPESLNEIYSGKENDSKEIVATGDEIGFTNVMEATNRSYSPEPPPLPISEPPMTLKRYNSSEFLNVCEASENLINGTDTIKCELNGNIDNPVELNRESDHENDKIIQVHQLTTSSPNGSDSDTDSSSEISGHYNLSAYYSVFKSENKSENNPNDDLPYVIDNLKDEPKTVRSKIKPGTVEDIKQMFVKKRKKSYKRRKPKISERLGQTGISHQEQICNERKDRKFETKNLRTSTAADDTMSLAVQTSVSNTTQNHFSDYSRRSGDSEDVDGKSPDIPKCNAECKFRIEKGNSDTVLHHEEIVDESVAENDRKGDEKNKAKTVSKTNDKINEYAPQSCARVRLDKLSDTETNETAERTTLVTKTPEDTLQDNNYNLKSVGDLKQNEVVVNKPQLNVLIPPSTGESESGTYSYNINENSYQSHSLKLQQGEEATLQGYGYSSTYQLPAKEKTSVSGERDDTINNTQTTSYVDCDKSETYDELCQAYHTAGSKDGIIDDHVTTSLTNIQLSTCAHPQLSNRIHVLTQADDKSRKSVEDLSDRADTETATIVVLKELSLKSKMPEKSSGQAKTAESSEYIGGKKISTKITTSRTCNGDTLSEDQNDNTEASNALAALADAVAKINEDNKDEILPEINQSVTKLNGGNLVITTLTRKVVEEENVEEGSHSSGRGSPVENKNQNVYYVQDHKGDTYMVEDITDDSQESAYFSSIDSRHASESSGHYDISGYNSPYIQGVHNLQAVGRTGIDYSTAEEVLLGLFNPNYSGEIVETGEYSYERDHSGMSKTSQLQVQPYGYVTDSSFNKKTTTLEYDREHGTTPQITYPMGASSVKTVKSSYEMSAPWGTDGNNGYILDQTDGEGYNMRKEESVETTNVDQTGINTMSAAYLLQGSYQVPQVPLVPQPVPYPIVTPLVIPDQSQIRLHKLDITPNIDNKVIELVPSEEQKTVETETVECKNTASFMSAEYKSGGGEQKMAIGTDEVDSSKKKTEVERPVYKTVALVKGPYDTPKWTNTKVRDEPDSHVIDTRKYKILNSRASDETQEKNISFNEAHAYRVNRTENYENEKKRLLDENQNFHYSYSSPKTYVVSHAQTPEQHRYRTEKHFQINRSPDTAKKHRTHIEVSRDFVGGDRMGNFENREEKKHVTKKEMKAEEFYRMNTEPIHLLNSDASSDIKVVRGNILIKNTMDGSLDEFNDNINVFDKTFNLSKENPLYQSDEDIFKRYETERIQQQQQHSQRQGVPRRQPGNDITFETVDRYSKTKEVKREPVKIKPKQNLSQILLSRLSTIDAKDIRQHIDVKHHNEEIYGDISFIHADGSRSASGGTQNFDSVSEDIDLALRDGKAYITIKVTAERISPIDMEFNVWKKNQAIVTRLIEIDLLANEQRRRLYHKVMETDGHSGYQTQTGNFSNFGRMKPQETILSSADTLNLFAEIMNATDGEGDQEDITVKTSQSKTVKPPAFLY